MVPSGAVDLRASLDYNLILGAGARRSGRERVTEGSPLIEETLGRIAGGEDLSMEDTSRGRGDHAGALRRRRDRASSERPAPEGGNGARDCRGCRGTAPPHDGDPHAPHGGDRHLRHRGRWLEDFQHQHRGRDRHRGGRGPGGQAWQSPGDQHLRLGRRAGHAGGQHRGRRTLGRSLPGRAGNLLLFCPAAARRDQERRPGPSAARYADDLQFAGPALESCRMHRINCWASGVPSCVR